MTFAHPRMAFISTRTQQLGTKISMTQIRLSATTIYTWCIGQENAKIMQHGSLFNELEIQLQFRVFACHFKSKFRNFPGMYIVNLFQFIIQRVIEIYYLSVIYSSHKTLF